jgi:flagellar biosynthesis protein FlhA
MTDGKSNMVVALAVMAMVAMLIMPLPTILLDGLMVLNLVLPLLILLVVLLYAKKVKDFSSLPTLLLVVTCLSLALNVSCARLILTKGAAFDGKMVKTFSSFIVGSGGTEGLVVGSAIFIIISVVQAIVITQGMARIAETADRFRLDILPEKQKVIEAVHSSLSIAEEETRRRKDLVQKKSDFYSNMAKAGEFISGNAKVGIFIPAATVLGGIVIGTRIYGQTVSDAVRTYAAFSIGAGFLFQFFTLLVSTSTGIIVQRSLADKTWQ